ncbi:MAG: NUDIX hydrolase [Bacteroidetes bacterium]|nr:NUDIX hydrolase [Bacteroidota bacterium]
MQIINRFNVRVYGVLMNDHDEVLLVHERIGDFEFTKFPGGGMDFGEGTRDCLKREFLEEANLDVEIGQHIFTTDYFQPSAFNKTDQLLAIYYWVHPNQSPINISLEEFEIINHDKPEYLRFFWVNRSELKADMLTFPVDKMVCNMLGYM